MIGDFPMTLASISARNVLATRLWLKGNSQMLCESKRTPFSSISSTIIAARASLVFLDRRDSPLLPTAALPRREAHYTGDLTIGYLLPDLLLVVVAHVNSFDDCPWLPEL